MQTALSMAPTQPVLGIYMDYQASAPLDRRVLDAMMPFLLGIHGNPHAADHAYGWEADSAIAEARSAVARLIGADPDEIIFTSGATEANNLAILGAARAAPAARRRIVVSAVEHKCVLGAARALVEEGYELAIVPVDSNGLVHADAVQALVDERTAVVSIMTVNNEVGTAQPIAEIAKICRATGALFHTDAAQAPAAVSVDVAAWDVDLLSLSGHKAYGPKGVGALYVRRGVGPRLRPVLHGGGQEGGLRPGTLPTPLCVGMGAACIILAADGEREAERVASLRDQLLADLGELIPDLRVNGALANRHPGNLNIRVPGIDAELLLAAARPGLAAATGSACTSGISEPSHVLRAMGLSGEAAAESIRLSIGRFTTADEVRHAAGLLAGAAKQVRERLEL